MNISVEWKIHLYDILGGGGKGVSLLEFNQSSNPYNIEEQGGVPQLALLLFSRWPCLTGQVQGVLKAQEYIFFKPFQTG